MEADARYACPGLKLLIIPNSEVFDPSDVPVLKDWIAHGGKLIITGNSGMRAGEKGNFQPLAARHRWPASRRVYLRDDPGAAFTNARTTARTACQPSPQLKRHRLPRRLADRSRTPSASRSTTTPKPTAASST